MEHTPSKKPSESGATMPPAVGENATRSDLPPASTPYEEIARMEGDPNFMTSLARGLAVIGAFGQQRRNPTIADLSRKTGISRAAVRRCLYTLVKMGYAVSDDRGFALRPKILSLGHAYLSSAPIAQTAQPILERVSSALHESCSLAILDGDEIAYVARSATRRIMSVALSVGSRLPAYCTSMGRVILAHLPPTELDSYLGRVRLAPLTERTVTSRDELQRLLNLVRENDYAVVDQELEIGLRSIAVPVRERSGKVIAAMNVSVQAGRIRIAAMETKFLPELRSAAYDLGMVLTETPI